MATVLQACAPEKAEEILASLDLQALPRHVAIIMDGNGRWAEGRGLSRCEGHSAGVEAIRRAVNSADDLGIRYLSIYSFSTENSERPVEEVAYLYDLFTRVPMAEAPELNAKNVRMVVTGLLDWLPEAPAAKFREAIELTAGNTGLTLNICVMYGGRTEILDAARSMADAAMRGDFDLTRLTENSFRRFLYHPDIPDPDMVIRTSGEQRISNFLLWQIAYSELIFTEVLWPDFSNADFLAAVQEYQVRHRRFGRL
ncbi:di-trans,poly-cis-decaprenylcistransferase [bacterium]|nr:di-trans,poly-cis-decaprenylcistransferase [bacterium]